MTKPILFALLAVAGTMICTDDAYARCGCRSRCCAPAASCCTNQCAQSTCDSGCSNSAAPMTAAPMNGPMVAGSQTAPNSNSTYQSFSYEPGSSPATAPVTQVRMYQAPAPMVYRSTNWEYESVLRNHKVINTPY